MRKTKFDQHLLKSVVVLLLSTSKVFWEKVEELLVVYVPHGVTKVKARLPTKHPLEDLKKHPFEAPGQWFSSTLF